MKNKKKEQKDLKELAFKKAVELAKFIKKNYDVKKIYLYGSLARSGKFDFLSDIDIYIEGWDESNNYWRMLSEVECIASPIPLSIVTEKEAFESLKEEIYKEGRILSE